MLYETYPYNLGVGSLSEGSSPVEVRLVRGRINIAGAIRHEDDSTEALEIDARTMLGAEREASAKLSKLGYTPAGRWAAGVRVFRHSRD